MTRVFANLLLAGACALAFATSAVAGKFTLLHTFQGGKDGRNPVAALTPDGTGGFYGTTGNGGRNKGCLPEGCGTVFHIGSDGAESILYAFKGGTDGAFPAARVTIGADGALYGTTVNGGGSGCSGFGCGTVYRLTTEGQETILHAFTAGADGAQPKGSVTFDTNGDLFGTTTAGGDPSGETSNGTVFEISPQGEERIFYVFTGQPDAYAPPGNLVLDNAGNLYGTSASGGSANEGTVFKLTPQGGESVLYSFQGDGGGNTDGRMPTGDLIIDQAGNLYGATQRGGAVDRGTVFTVSSSGTETLLHSFDPGADGSGGSLPEGGVIAEGGNLYGTTSGQGGNVYEFAADGTFTVLHAFGNGRNGISPYATVASDGLGNLYGTTLRGGRRRGPCFVEGCGTVFRVKK